MLMHEKTCMIPIFNGISVKFQWEISLKFQCTEIPVPTEIPVICTHTPEPSLLAYVVRLKSCVLAKKPYIQWNFTFTEIPVPTKIPVICIHLPEPLLLTDVVSTEILCTGNVAICSVEFH